LGTAPTAARRRGYIGTFEGWLSEQGRPPLQALAGDAAQLDRVFVVYGQHLWDSGRSQAEFVELLNGVGKLFSAVKGRLHGAWDIRSAWQALEPGTNRAPVPATLLRAMMAIAWLWGWHEFASLLALAFEACLRPGDVLHLGRADLRFCDEHGGGPSCSDLFVILRFSKTALVRGARWQHVRVACHGTIALMRKQFGSREPAAMLFTHAGAHAQRARAFGARFLAVLAFLQVPYGEQDGFVPSGLRAGGITAFFMEHEDLGLTRWRGRWDNARSMEHYVQELPYHSAFSSLPARVRARVFAYARLLPSVLASSG